MVGRIHSVKGRLFLSPGKRCLIKPSLFHRLGEECAPDGFPTAPPDTALFDPTKVVLVSNGR